MFLMQSDKQKHIAAGAIIGALSLPILELWAKVPYAFILSVLIVGFVGWMKELVWDRWMGRGCYEVLDIVATAIGGIIGAVSVELIRSII